MRLFLSLMIGAAIAVPACAQQSNTQNEVQTLPESPKEAMRDGNTLMAAGKYCEALKRYDDGLRSLPDNLALLYNGGLAAYRCNQFNTSVKLWSKLKQLDPTDWQTRAKLIQAYQALGLKSERDSERSELMDLWRKGSVQELSKQTEFCRDQFEAGGERVMAFEQFELKGDRALRYVFSIVNDAGNGEKYRLSLGSYDVTNAIWRETTKPKPKPEERLFHLDGYYDWGHATYGMYSPEPSYDEVRTTVIEILEKKRSPVSTTVRPAQK